MRHIRELFDDEGISHLLEGEDGRRLQGIVDLMLARIAYWENRYAKIHDRFVGYKEAWRRAAAELEAKKNA